MDLKISTKTVLELTDPSRAEIAAFASARELIVTKPHPRLMPVTASRETCKCSHSKVLYKAYFVYTRIVKI